MEERLLQAIRDEIRWIEIYSEEIEKNPINPVRDGGKLNALESVKTRLERVLEHARDWEEEA